MGILRKCWEWLRLALWVVCVIPVYLLFAAFLLLVFKAPTPYRLRHGLHLGEGREVVSPPGSPLWEAWQDPGIRSKYHLRRFEMSQGWLYLAMGLVWVQIICMVVAIFFNPLSGTVFWLMMLVIFSLACGYVMDRREAPKVEAKVTQAYLGQLSS